MDSDFHMLTQDERALVSKIVRRRNLPGLPWDAIVAYSGQGNFTLATIVFDDKVKVGAAKRLPTDRPESDIGATIALARAVAARPMRLERG